MRIRSAILFSLLLTAGNATAADLLQIYREAARTNPQLAAAQANLEAVRELRPQAKAGLLPSVGAGAAITRKRFKNIDPSEPARYSTDKTASINLTQPLFNYDRWLSLKQADSRIAATEAQYLAASQDLMVLVAQRYFKVLEAQDNVQFAQAEKNAISRQLDQAKQRFDVGLIAITDVKAAQARYDLAVSQEIQAVSDLAAAKDALHETVGVYYDDVDELDPELKLTGPQPDVANDWIERAKQHNLNILAAQANAEAAQQEIQRRRAGHLPTLDFDASTGYSDVNFGGIIPITRHDTQFGIELNVPLYSGGLVTSQTREARSRFQESTEQLSQAIRAAELETRNAFRGIKTDIAQVKALQRSLESTEVAVQAEEAGFEVGTRTIVDLLNSQRESYLARLNYARARYQYVVDQLRLKRAAGILDESDIEAVNAALIPADPGAQ